MGISRRPREELRKKPIKREQVKCMGTPAHHVNAIHRMVADGTPLLATHRIKGVEE